MTFAKLDSGIIFSSLWDQPDHVIRVWIMILAKKDENGFVLGTMGSLSRVANISNDPDGRKFEEAIRILESPDPESKTPDNEGRRIERIEGGWIVVNHEAYKTHENVQREKTRIRVQKHREKKKSVEIDGKNGNVTLRNVTVTPECVTSVSVSTSVSLSESVFEEFRKKYPGSKRGFKTEYDNFRKKHRDHNQVGPILLSSLENQIQWREEMRTAGMFVPEWKNLQTWINQRCWENEKPVIIAKVSQNNNHINNDPRGLME